MAFWLCAKPSTARVWRSAPLAMIRLWRQVVCRDDVGRELFDEPEREFVIWGSMQFLPLRRIIVTKQVLGYRTSCPVASRGDAATRAEPADSAGAVGIATIGAAPPLSGVRMKSSRRSPRFSFTLTSDDANPPPDQRIHSCRPSPVH